METGGAKKSQVKDDASDNRRKLIAIETIVRHGPRWSEWTEAGCLRAIEKVLNGHPTSADDLKKLMEEAGHF